MKLGFRYSGLPELTLIVVPPSDVIFFFHLLLILLLHCRLFIIFSLFSLFLFDVLAGSNFFSISPLFHPTNVRNATAVKTSMTKKKRKEDKKIPNIQKKKKVNLILILTQYKNRHDKGMGGGRKDPSNLAYD